MDRITGVQLFARIVETGSFSKASADLGITQPTATKHVAALEAKLGARLLNRNTRGVSATEIGALYYEKCKAIQRELDEADSLAALLQSKVGGQLRISTSVAFGRRVVTPLALRFMREHPEISIDLSFDDRYVNLVEQGVDVALRMGRLADSALGARYLGINPWLTAAAPDYLARARHAAGAGRPGARTTAWSTAACRATTAGPSPRAGGEQRLGAGAAARCARTTCRPCSPPAAPGMGLAVLPWYVARESVADGSIVPVLDELRAAGAGTARGVPLAQAGAGQGAAPSSTSSSSSSTASGGSARRERHDHAAASSRAASR